MDYRRFFLMGLACDMAGIALVIFANLQFEAGVRDFWWLLGAGAALFIVGGGFVLFGAREKRRAMQQAPQPGPDRPA